MTMPTNTITMTTQILWWQVQKHNDKTNEQLQKTQANTTTTPELQNTITKTMIGCWDKTDNDDVWTLK